MQIVGSLNVQDFMVMWFPWIVCYVWGVLAFGLPMFVTHGVQFSPAQKVTCPHLPSEQHSLLHIYVLHIWSTPPVPGIILHLPGPRVWAHYMVQSQALLSSTSLTLLMPLTSAWISIPSFRISNICWLIWTSSFTLKIHTIICFTAYGIFFMPMLVFLTSSWTPSCI